MAEKPKSAPRKYRVFQDPSEGVLVDASSAEQAIRLVATDKGGGYFGATPDGNWTTAEYASVPQPPKLELVDRTPQPSSPGQAAAAARPSATERLAETARDAEPEQRTIA